MESGGLFLQKDNSTRYETHDGELLAIIKAFKTWRHYFVVNSLGVRHNG